MQHTQDSAVLSERILTDKAPQERRALGARRRAPRIDAMIVPAVENAVFHGPGQRRAGIIADSVRIGKAAQDVLRLRRVCNAREAGIAVEDDRQILTADGLRGAERVRAAAVDRTGEILDVQRPEQPAQALDTPATPGKPGDSAAPAGSEISISEALSRVLQELGISLPDIRDVNVQRVQVSGRDAYHITFTANGKPYSFYVDTHDGDLF